MVAQVAELLFLGRILVSNRGIKASLDVHAPLAFLFKSLWRIQHGPKSAKVLLISAANKSSSVNTRLPRCRVGLILWIYISRPTHYHILYAPAPRASWQSGSILPFNREVKQVPVAEVITTLERRRNKETFCTLAAYSPFPALSRPMVTF